MASNEAALLIKLVGDKSGLDATLKGAEGKVQEFSNKAKSSFGGLGSSLAGLIGTAAIGKFAFDIIKGADEIGTAVASLQTKISNLNPEIKQSSADIRQFADALSVGTKFIDDEIIPALDKAIVLTQDYGTAQRVTADAVKLATVANIPLGQAVENMALAYQGNTRGMSQLAKLMGVNIKDGETYASILAKIEKSYKGMSDVVAGDLGTTMKKFKDDSMDLFEGLLIPNIKYLQEAVRYLSIAVKGLFSVILVTGQTLGNTFGLAQRMIDILINKIKGKNTDSFSGAMQDFIDQTKKGISEVKKLFDSTAKTPPKFFTPKGGPKDELAMSKEDMEAFAELQKIVDARKAEQKKIDEQAAKDMEAHRAAEMDGMDKLTEKYIDSYTKINTALNSMIFSALDNLVDQLFQGGQAWGEWGKNAVSALTKVIAKMILMQTLQAILGPLVSSLSGSILGAIGIKPTAALGASGSPSIQIITADPSTTVNFINGAYAQATPKGQAQLWRNVQRGQIMDYNR